MSSVDLQTFSVGDYVYSRPGREGGSPRLARIESAHALQSNQGQLWLVRRRMRSGWESGQLHALIERPLDDKELEHCRRLGLIPTEGEALR